MKAILWISLFAWFICPALGQERGHYDLLSVDEVIQDSTTVVSIISWERQKVEITVQKPAQTPLEIRIRTADRQLIASDYASRYAPLYRKVLNLSQLESGRYWLEVQLGNKLIRRELWLEAVQQTYRSLTMH